MIHLSTPIKELTRVGKVTAGRLARLGIENAKDLLNHFPHRYDDFSRTLALGALEIGAIGSLAGTIVEIKSEKTQRKKMSLATAILADDNGEIRLVWFNQPFVADVIKAGALYVVSGTIERDYNGWVMKNPNYEKAEDNRAKGKILPIYPATNNLTQKQFRFLIGQAREALPEITDILPEKIKKNLNLIDRQAALTAIHWPNSQTEIQAALKRLKFEELFLIQVLNEKARAQIARARAPRIKFDENKTKNLVKDLPFNLTNDQRQAAWQILKDLAKETPMNRLLEGEVGSGKTVVAAIAALNAFASGFQTAFMAPTEILALQHYKTISAIFPNRTVVLLTGKYARLETDAAADRRHIKEIIREGKAEIVIGTHAVIQKDVAFKNLGLIIIDEQHRFGVDQRKELRARNSQADQDTLTPHLLSMTATPIPRSLALALYGDLDISVIKEMPKNRKPIATRLVEERDRAKAYAFIREKAAAGRQAFVICPLIEESDKLGVKSAAAEYEKLKKNIFPDCAIGLLHGRLKPAEKEKIMTDFKDNKTNILVSTSVVEVGVDVPNAVLMMIEGAERFGLSQLHQFRGRVGRGEHQSYCFLFPSNWSRQTRERLNSFVSARDGFAIAELDLKLRGPGDLFGTDQSGYLSGLKIATLTDTELMSEARAESQLLLAEDLELKKYPNLDFEIKKMQKSVHLE